MIEKICIQARVRVDFIFNKRKGFRIGKWKSHIFNPAPPPITIEDARQFSISTDGFHCFGALLMHRHVRQREQVVAFIGQFD